MSLAWKETKKFVDSLGNYPKTVKKTELEKVVKEKPFKQGDFTPNYFSSGYGLYHPDAIGMTVEKTFVIDREGYDKILSLAKERNLTVKEECSTFNLYDSKGIRVAQILKSLFIASDPDLFEGIGTKLYGLKTDSEKK